MKVFARLCDAFTSPLGFTAISTWQDSLSQQPLGRFYVLKSLPVAVSPKGPEFSPPHSSLGFMCR